MAQLKEGSVIKKTTGDEVIATVSDMPSKVSELENDSGYITIEDIPSEETQITITSATEPSLSVGDQWHREI